MDGESLTAEEQKKAAKEFCVAFASVMDEAQGSVSDTDFFGVAALTAEMFAATVIEKIVAETEVDENELLTLFVRSLDERLRK